MDEMKARAYKYLENDWQKDESIDQAVWDKEEMKLRIQECVAIKPPKVRVTDLPAYRNRRRQLTFALLCVYLFIKFVCLCFYLLT